MQPSPSLLVVDDDPDIRVLIEYNLRQAGYTVFSAASGEESLKIYSESPATLVLLDLMLPGIDGFEVCSHLVAASRRPSIIMISALGEEAQIVRGLELGADDYIVKPFSIKVLLARVSSVLRRARPASVEEQTLVFGPVSLDLLRHQVLISGNELVLTATEFRLLSHFLRNRGRVFTRTQIIKAVHGDDYPVTDRSVDVQIVGLRRKLGEAGRYIDTVRGVGYRFQEEP